MSGQHAPAQRHFRRRKFLRWRQFCNATSTLAHKLPVAAAAQHSQPTRTTFKNPHNSLGSRECDRWIESIVVRIPHVLFSRCSHFPACSSPLEVHRPAVVYTATLLPVQQLFRFLVLLLVGGAVHVSALAVHGTTSETALCTIRNVERRTLHRRGLARVEIPPLDFLVLPRPVLVFLAPGAANCLASAATAWTAGAWTAVGGRRCQTEEGAPHTRNPRAAGRRQPP